MSSEIWWRKVFVQGVSAALQNFSMMLFVNLLSEECGFFLGIKGPTLIFLLL